MSNEERDTGSGRRLDNRQIMTAVAAVLLIWFAIANWQSVPIHFWVTTTRAPVFLVIVVSAVLGGFMAWLARRVRRPKAPRS